MGEFRTSDAVRAGLTEPERALLRAIIDGRLAWSYWSALALAGHAVETAGALELAGLVVPWHLPDGHALTLTPWGACVCGVWIVERVVVLGEELEEDPVWTDGSRVVPPLRLPKRAREIRYPWPDQLPDLKQPEFLKDEESGQEVKLFEGKPLPSDGEELARPLAGGIGGGTATRGVRVKIDPKLLGGKARQKRGGVSDEYLLRTGKPRRRGPKRAG